MRQCGTKYCDTQGINIEKEQFTQVFNIFF